MSLHLIYPWIPPPPPSNLGKHFRLLANPTPTHAQLAKSMHAPLLPTNLRPPEVLPVNHHAILLHVRKDASKVDPVLLVEFVQRVVPAHG